MKKQVFLGISLLGLFCSAILAQTPPNMISGGIINGKAISLPAPEYPAAAKAVGASGPVNVQVVIDETGNIISADAVSGHPLLRSASEKAAHQATFKPTLLSGNPVKVSGIIVYVYSLPPNEEDPTPGTISGGVVNGKATSLPAPEYPAAAMAVRASGAVSVQVLIDENGEVVSASAVSGHPLLRAASEKAANQAKFLPTILSGVSVKVSGVIVYVFTPPPADSGESDEDIAFVSISASLRVMTRVNSDPKLSSVADLFFSVFGKEIAGEDLPEEMASMKELSRATPARRTEILVDLNLKLIQQITGDESWQYSVGEVLGDLMAESLKRSGVGLSEPDLYKVALLKLRNLMTTAPNTFPKDLLAKCKEIAKFGERESLDDPELLDQIDQKLAIIEDIVLGEAGEN